MQGTGSEEESLATLWAWCDSPEHLLRPSPRSWLCQAGHQNQLKAVLKALHSHPQIGDQPSSQPKLPSLDSFVARLVKEEMALEDGQGAGLHRSTSWSRGRQVSWDEMRSLGLHKALNEYYKMTTPKGSFKGSMVRQHSKRRSGGSGLLLTLLCTTVLHPLPFLLTPEALYAAASWAVYLLAVLIYQSAVLTVPLALWLASLSISGSALQLPPALLRALPALSRLELPSLPPQPVVLGGLLAFLLVLRAAERMVRRVASEKAAHAAHALRPEQLEEFYAGWQMPESRAPQQQAPLAEDAAAGSDEEGHALQHLARETALVCERVYGEGSGPGDLDSYADLVAFVLRLCNDAGVQTQSTSHPSPEALLELLQQAKRAIGIP